MGGNCSCFQSEVSLAQNGGELEYFISNYTYQDTDPIQLDKYEPQIHLKRILKRYIMSSYINKLKFPQQFILSYPTVNTPLKSIESLTIKNTEEEYGEYRTTPVWGEYLIPAPLVSIDDIVYIGEWDFLSKIPHGTGISYNKITGEKYSGNFKLFKKHGLGRLIFPSGDLYEGEFVEGEMHGNGTLLYIQGKVYIGEFSKGYKHGYGKEQDRHETCYEGEYVKDKRVGNGKLIWADGRSYVGEFFDDKIHGIGECWWPDEKSYYGQWEKDKMHGEGNCVWTDGREYSGEYYKGIEDGNGKMLFPNGDIYDGTWRNGKQHGFGIMRTLAGEKKRRMGKR